MLYTLAIILLILWALGYFAFSFGGNLIHALVVIALIVFIVQMLSGRRAV